MTNQADFDNNNTKNSEKDESKRTDYRFIFWITVGIIFILTCLYGIGMVKLFGQPDSFLNDRGTFGDMYGALNALFSGCAFAGIIVTILMQRKELLYLSDQLKASADAQDKSQQALNDQLQQMKVSARIDQVNSFIQSLQGDEDYDKREAAKELLVRLNHELFLDPEHQDVIKPRFNFSEPFYINPDRGVPDNSVQAETVLNITVPIFNIGMSCTIKSMNVKVSTSSSDDYMDHIEDRRYQLKRLNRRGSVIKTLGRSQVAFHRDSILHLEIRKITRGQTLKVELHLEGELVPYNWICMLWIKTVPKLKCEFSIQGPRKNPPPPTKKLPV